MLRRVFDLNGIAVGRNDDHDAIYLVQQFRHDEYNAYSELFYEWINIYFYIYGKGNEQL